MDGFQLLVIATNPVHTSLVTHGRVAQVVHSTGDTSEPLEHSILGEDEAGEPSGSWMWDTEGNPSCYLNDKGPPLPPFSLHTATSLP